MFPEKIKTRRLQLRRPSLNDVEAIFKFSSDASVVRWLPWLACTDEQSIVADVKSYRQKWDGGELYYWLVVASTVASDIAAHEASGTTSVIGSVACRSLGDTVDIGFVIDSDCWGHGYASEAATAVFSMLSGLEEVSRIVAICDSENVASARILEKIGMQCKGVAKGFVVCPNLSSDARDALVFSHDCSLAECSNHVAG